MRRPRQKLQVSTFPFLAVLLCAMGSLILFLLVMDRRAKIVARNKALQARQESAERLAARAALQAEQQRARKTVQLELLARKTSLAGETERIRRQLGEAAQKLDAQQAGYAQLIQQFAKEKANVTAAEEALKRRRSAAAEAARKEDERDRATRAERERLTFEVRQMEEALRQLQARKHWARNVYSVVPYGGKRGAARRPIYVECTRAGLVLHPDRTVLSGPATAVLGLRSEIESRSGQRLRRALPASIPGSGSSTDPYVLFLVRPEGIASYHEAQAALQGLQVDFGYELIDSDWVLDFSTDGRPVPGPVPARTEGGISHGGTGSGGRGGPGGGVALGRPSTLPSALGPPGSGAAPRGSPGVGGGPSFGVPGGAGRGMTAGVPGAGGGTRPPGPYGNGGSGRPSGLLAGSGGMTAAPPGGGRLPGIGGGGTTPGTNGPVHGMVGTTGPIGGGTGGASAPRPFVLGGVPDGRGSGPALVTPLPGTVGSRGPGTGNSAPNDVTWKRGTEGHAAAGPLLQRPVPRTASGTPGKGRVIASANEPASPALPGVPAGSGEPVDARSAGQQPDSSARPPEQPLDPEAPRPLIGARPGGSGEANPLARHLPPWPTDPATASRRKPTVRVFGSRDFQVTIDCYADRVRIVPGGATFRWPAGAERESDAALTRYVVELVRRRQATVRPGEPPYQPVLLLNVNPGGQRTYLRAYPALEPLRLPMRRENRED